MKYRQINIVFLEMRGVFIMKKKTVQEWDKIGKSMLGDFYETSQESESIQKKLDSGELINVCSNDKVNALPLDIVEKYTKPMKW